LRARFFRRSFSRCTKGSAAVQRAVVEKEAPLFSYLVIAAVIGVLVVIFILFRTRTSPGLSKTPSASTRPTNGDEIAAPGLKEKLPCPLCGTRLYEGERIRSVAFDLGEEKFMQIYGCRHCSGATPSARRRCPVCRRNLPATGFVVGRMWEKNNRTRLHISGCTECRPHYKEMVVPKGKTT